MARLTDGVRKIVLGNGLTTLTKKNHNSPAVAIFTFVKAGYLNESDTVAGISHLTEHMFFKGTRRRGVGEIAQETRELGGFLNASTIYDHTLYYTVLPAKNFSQGLDIQADALMNSIFDAEELRKETEVVIEESKRKLDTPAAVAREKLFELAFTRHRMRRWRIGTEEGLRRLTRDDFLTFYRDLYRPENIILTVVGDIDLDQAECEIEKYYGGFERGTLVKEESPAEPSQTVFRYKRLSGSIQQSHLIMGFHTPGIFHPDNYALEVLAFVLGQGRSSRLNQRVKETQQCVDSIAAYNYSLKELGILMMEAICRPGRIHEAVSAVACEIAELQQHPITSAEIEKARTQIETHYVFNQETAAGQASVLAMYEALGDYRLVEDYLGRLYRVDADEVQRVAGKYLTLSNCSLLEYVARDENVDASSTEEAMSCLKALPEGPPGKSEAGAGRAESAEVDCVVSPGVCNKETEAKRFVLSNGVTVIAKENHDVPVIAMGVYVQGGRLDETPENCGISGLAARTALKGTRTRSAAELAAEIERLGSHIHFGIDPDYLSCTMNILSKHLDAGWNILADVLRNPVFPEAEVAKERQLTLGKIKRLRDDTFRYPLSLFYSVIFQKHAYGLPALGTVDTIEQLTRNELESWHFQHLSPEKLVVVAVGDFEAERLQQMLEASLGKLSSGGDDLQPNAASLEFGQPDIIVQDSEKEQTALVLGFPGPAFASADRYRLTVLQNVLSGLGGRFFEELRGRHSLAYTVATYLVARRVGGTFFTYIATSPGKENKARDCLIQQFKEILNSPISETELRRSVNYTTGTYQTGLASYRAQMARYAHNEVLGLDIGEADAFPRKIKGVSAEDVLATAQKYFDLESFAQAVVRGRAE
ncbi:MAG: pitrilysin family protein [Calditrichaeota bacterium]|nr:pitrilysin family protein [Calditrichota bacterium]